jgi:hypothetical protein
MYYCLPVEGTCNFSSMYVEYLITFWSTYKSCIGFHLTLKFSNVCISKSMNLYKAKDLLLKELAVVHLCRIHVVYFLSVMYLSLPIPTACSTTL